jgi:YHS domain-containing protein
MDPGDEVIDPVCGMTITKAKAPFNADHNGSAYYFCSAQCASSFDADADAFAAAAKLNLPGWGQTPHPESVVKQFRRN